MTKETAMKILKELHDNSLFSNRTALETIIPELKESEDEKIKKALIRFHKSTIDVDGIKGDDILAWLEKQGNNTPTIIWHNIDEKPKEMKELFCEWESDDATWHDVAFYDEESHTFRHAKMPINVTKWIYVDELLEKQCNEKKDFHERYKKVAKSDWFKKSHEGMSCGMITDKNEYKSKFKVGDWITNGRYNRLIVGINSDWPFYMFKDGTSKRIKDIENKYHLWTIQDAKDGDVLVDKYGNIGIYQGDKNAVRWNSYCYCGVNKVFYDEGSHEFPCYPATKEQQDTLEKAMADAGYTFDFEKKELKKPQRMISAEAKEALYDKVEPKFNIGDVLCDKSCTTLDKNSQPNIEILDIRAGMYICNNCSFPISQQDEYELVAKRIVPQSAAWSDEDEKMYKIALSCIETLEDITNGKNMHADVKDWLKSLKDRIGG